VNSGRSKRGNELMTRRQLHIFVLVFSLSGFSWLAWNALDHSGGHAIPVCLIKTVTGIPCPSCGTTRAMVTLMQGRLTESVLQNPFGVLLALGAVVFPFWIAVDILRGTSGFHRFYTSMESHVATRGWIPFAGAGIVLLNWVWNIAKGF
jgi:hypothetical protein